VDTGAHASISDEAQGPNNSGDTLADRGRRLFEFLAQAQLLKTKPPLTTDAYLHDGSVLWMRDLPEHLAVRSAHRVAEPESEQPLLVVERVPASAAPPVPKALAPWLEGPTDNENNAPQLCKSIPNPTPLADDGSDVELALDDHPDVHEAHELWQPQWAAWAQIERDDRPVRDLYGSLFSTYVKVTSHTEEFELILGIGCLAWSPAGHPPLRRHLLTSPAAIVLDDDSGTITVSAQPAFETLTVELDMIDPSLVPNPVHINDVRRRASDFEQHPLHRADTGDLIRRLVHSLDASSEYRDEDEVPAFSPSPRAAYAPAIIVRKRSQMGLVDIFNTIAHEITESGKVPSGLIPLLDPDHVPATTADTSDGAMVSVDDEVFLPLPLNQVQLDIIRRVDSHAQTLVQGPPGTGKTHVAAALLTHLLAQGKRVLVTAHTDRALKEVRGKLPESIKPLAVAVIGAERSDMADLKVAVERISSSSTDHDVGESRATIQDCVGEIDSLRRRRAQIRQELVEARRTEVSPHEHAGYEGTLARIAQDYQSQAGQHGWVADLVTSHADVVCPLDVERATRWLRLLRDTDLVADEPEADHRLVAMAGLPSPEEFASLVDAESAAAQGATLHDGLSEHDAFSAVAALVPEARSALQSRMRELARKAGELEQRHESWMNQALNDIRGGRGQTWIARSEHVGQLINSTLPLVESLGPATDVTVDSSADRGALTALARLLHLHVLASGPVKTNPDGAPKIGAFTNKVVKQARPLFEAVRVNGHFPTTAEHLTAFLTHVDAELQLAALDKAWPSDLVIPVEDTLRERLQWHATELEQLGRLLALGRELTIEEANLAQVGLAKPDWNDVASVLTYARLVDAVTAKDAHTSASQPLTLLEATTGAVSTWADSADCVHRLYLAVRVRDRDQYSAARARLVRLYEVRAMTADRSALTNKIREVAPDVADGVLADPAETAWDDRIPNLPSAWDWARTGAWILEQETTDTNVLQAQVGAIETRLRRVIEVLAATRAWDHAVSPTRLTGQSRADLTQYAQLVRRLGKGTGKYAISRRGEIRAAMDRCRPAVPVWIMPIYRIAEQLRVTQNMFDVVIVDEASQAGLEATFLQYLAPKIVVIGDDKQVSPTAVGVDQQKLRDLANLYLPDDRYKASWQDPKRSLFDEANMRFGSKLTLIEHRRCVPEIIGFSNRIAYEPDNIRLIPVRQYGADRLEPIKAIHVIDGYEKGGSGNKINPAEVDAIVAQLEKCLADPRYDGLTFGVISLLGQAQARRIQEALLQRIPIEEWNARDLRCGDAADFQGSERDVVFLSMVSAPEPGQRMGALTTEMYMQRYNVAASRAKDQLWLIHSIGLDQLANSQDMRHHLLDYCYGVINRTRIEQEGACPSTVPDDVRAEPFDSLFEQRVYNRVVDRGFIVIPQYPANGYKLDLVVVGAKGRLAIECDGDAWHGPEAYERDLARQRDLERCGWQFFRIRESAYYVDQHSVLLKLWATLEELDIRPSGWLEEDLSVDVDLQILNGTDNARDLEYQATVGGNGVVNNEQPSGPGNDDVVAAPTRNADSVRAKARDSDAGTTGDQVDPRTKLGDAVDLTETCDSESQLPSVARRMGTSDDNALVEPPPSVVDFELSSHLATLRAYVPFEGELIPALNATRSQLVTALRDIVTAEGPVMGHRMHSAYVLASGGHRVGKQIGHALNTAISEAVRAGILVAENPLGQSGVKPRTYRLPGQSEVIVRQLGPRTLEQVPPLELAHLLTDAAAVSGWDATESLFKDVLHRLGRDRLSSQASQTLAAALPLARILEEKSDRSDT
jgi:very-short-patch-repair endonuclease